MKKIIIRQGKQTTLSISEPTPLPELINALFNAIHVAATSTYRSAPPNLQVEIKDDIYDMINIGASSVLQHFAPEIELRPNLTEQAILQAEDQIIEKQYAKSRS